MNDLAILKEEGKSYGWTSLGEVGKLPHLSMSLGS
jgi:hypothetical protein